MMNSRSRWYWPWNRRKPHHVKVRVMQSGVNYPGKTVFVLHPSFLLKAVICLFRGQMMLFHIWLQIMFMKEECAAMSKKKRGAVIGVTDDGYPIVTEDYSCPYFYRGPAGACLLCGSAGTAGMPTSVNPQSSIYAAVSAAAWKTEWIPGSVFYENEE